MFLTNQIIKYINKILSLKHGVVLFYNKPHIINLIDKIKKESDMLLSGVEGYQLYTIVGNTKKIPGELAEVGAYKGGSAKIILEAKERTKTFHIFDTFEGLPTPRSRDNFNKGEYATLLSDVIGYLWEYENRYVYKGIFPDENRRDSYGQLMRDKKFSFVHLDVDLYQSTLDNLKFFYPLMSQGGCVVIHDYQTIKAVRDAVDEHMEDKPEPIIELIGSQCLIVKI